MILFQSDPTAARRRISLYLVDADDGETPETGVTVSAGDIKISKAGGALANHAGTFTELATGDYYYEFTAGELDTLGFVSFRLVKTGVRTFRREDQVIAANLNDAAALGLSKAPAPPPAIVAPKVEAKPEPPKPLTEADKIALWRSQLRVTAAERRAAGYSICVAALADIDEAIRQLCGRQISKTGDAAKELTEARAAHEALIGKLRKGHETWAWDEQLNWVQARQQASQ